MQWGPSGSTESSLIGSSVRIPLVSPRSRTQLDSQVAVCVAEINCVFLN